MNTPIHSSHGEGPCRNTRPILSVLRTTADRVRRTARLALNNPTRRKLLKLIVSHPNGVTYRTLIDALDVSERWIRSIVADLRRDGIVETPGSPALIQFTSRDVALAVREVLSFIANEWADATAQPDHTADPAPSRQYLKTLTNIIRTPGGSAPG